MSTVGPSLSVSPNTLTLGDLKRQAARYAMGDNFPSVLKDAEDGVLSAIRRMNSRIWNWNTKTSDIALVTSQDEYDVPDDFFKPHTLARLDTNSKLDGVLTFMHPQEFLSQFTNKTLDGDPKLYTVLSRTQFGELVLSHTPKATFVTRYPNLRMHYFASIPKPVGDGNVVAVPDNVGEFILWQASWVVAARGSDVGKRDRAFAAAKDAWREILFEDSDQETTI